MASTSNGSVAHSKRPRIRAPQACEPCRSRKVKCDGADPCGRCAVSSIPCVFKEQQRRRGPDRTPGTRKRRTKAQKQHDDLVALGLLPSSSSPPEYTIIPTTSTSHLNHGSQYSRSRSASPDAPPHLYPGSRRLTDEANREQSMIVPVATGTTRVVPGTAPVMEILTATGSADFNARSSTQNRNAYAGFDSSTNSRSPLSLPGWRDHPSPVIQTQLTAPFLQYPQATVQALDYYTQSDELQTEATLRKAPPNYRRNDDTLQPLRPPTIAVAPSLEHYRKSWWDALLDAYSPERDTGIQEMIQDFRSLLRHANQLLSFLHMPSFLNKLARPESRLKLQPSLVLSVLALSSLMQSTGSKQGHKRRRAVLLYDRAVGALDAAINVQSLDPTLAQAALVIALYEISPHEFQSRERNQAALLRLDSLLLALGLTSMDRGHPAVSSFVSHSAPVVMLQGDVTPTHYSPRNHFASDSEDAVLRNSYFHHHLNFPQPSVSHPIHHDGGNSFEPLPQYFGYAPNGFVQSDSHSDYARGRDSVGREALSSLGSSSNTGTESFNNSTPATRCTCTDLSLAHNPLMIAGLSASAGAAQEARLSVGFTSSPAWNPDWSEAMIEREQSRTVVWSALWLTSSHASHQAAFGHPRTRFGSANPANFAVFFPGEELHLNYGYSTAGKESVWALYCRALLLWNACLEVHDNVINSSNTDQAAAFAMQVWLEVDRITKALDRHTCNTEQSYLWAGRSFLQFARMSVTYNYSRFVPSVHAGLVLPQRRETEEWAEHMAFFIKTSKGPELFRDLTIAMPWNPFLVWMFVDQYARCLRLWEQDRTHTMVLEIAKQIAPALDNIVGLFNPVPYFDEYRRGLNQRLAAALHSANIPWEPLDFTENLGEPSLYISGSIGQDLRAAARQA